MAPRTSKQHMKLYATSAMYAASAMPTMWAPKEGLHLMNSCMYSGCAARNFVRFR